MDNEEKLGHIHPLTRVIRRTNEIFSEMGFSLIDGPEIETEHYNFDALNIPKDHPARDMWDTFWLKPKSKSEIRNTKSPPVAPERSDGGRGETNSKLEIQNSKLLLRTHTSPVQIRYMENNKPPLRIISVGKTFRYEATDATHEAQFHQVEGLLVDKNANLSNLKYVIREFFEKFFEEKIELRLRPSYFPFVEPGVEIDISCFKCGGDKCSVCKQSGWIEVMGAGMVHPEVLKNVGLDPKDWKGFAFGAGVDRLAMLKYGVDDIRLFYTGDLRLTNQF